jgi:glucokinase
MTNHVWSFSIEQTRRQLGVDRFLVINDFTALAMALPHLEAADLHPVGSGQAVPEAPVALLGPGTGLGVSGLIHCGTHWMPLEGEGGHVTYGAANHRQAKIVSIVGERYSHVSAERLLSGQGLMNLYHAIATLHGVEIEPLSPPDITGRALKGSCPVCAEVLETFCAMLGTVAGNLVLTLGARRGVYIGGGIVPRLGAYFDTSPFRESFERKGRFTSYLASVPSYVIRAQYPALLGVAAALVGEGRAVSADR